MIKLEEVVKLFDEVKSIDIQTLKLKLNVTESNDFIALNKILNQLEDNNQIYLNDKDVYVTVDNHDTKEGIVIVKRSGAASIEDNEYGTLDINERDLLGAMNRDVVLYERFKHRAKVVKILKHNVDCVVGIIRIRNGKVNFYPDDMRIKGYRITNLKQVRVKDRVKVRCFITDYVKKEMKLDSIIAYADDPRSRELSILYSYNVPMEFNATVLNEAKSFKQEILTEDYPNRRDLSDELVITIDGDDSKDFDDAVSIQKVGEDYLLKVHIADVSHYVVRNSALDKAAKDRATSIYYANKVIPMLPFELSNELCSLKPGVKRLAITCEMLIDSEGNNKDMDIYESIITSKYRMTYNNVNKIIDGDEELSAKYHELLPMIEDMQALSHILRTKREEGGAIDFKEEEAKLVIKNEKVVDIVLRDRGIAEKMIEDFMIAANVTVASYMKYLEYPMVYRNHAYPKEERINNFVNVVETLGYHFKGNKYAIKSIQLKECLEYFEGTELEEIVSNLMLRSMAKAVYDNVCEGHYGLGLENYCHFTSPIRRYPDLIVHRMLKRYAFSHDNLEKMEFDESNNHSLALISSERERRAVNIERDIMDLKKCEYMRDKVGKVYDGIISSVLSFGFFVKLDNTVEGLVRVSDLDGFFEYDENMGVLYRDNIEYRVGQHLRVKVVDVDLRRCTIDFRIFKNKHPQRWI